MADARKFTNPDLAHPESRHGPHRPPGVSEGRRYDEHEEEYPHGAEPPRAGDDAPPPPRFAFRGEDLLKLLDGLTQGTVLAGIPGPFDPSPRLREITGKVLDQMGFPEDLMPAQAFNPKGRWKILVGCILVYAGLGVWQAMRQRSLTLSLVKQKMAEGSAGADGQATAPPGTTSGKEATGAEPRDGSAKMGSAENGGNGSY